MDNALIIAEYCEKKLIKNNLLFKKYALTEPCFIFTLLSTEQLSEQQKDYFEKVKFLLKFRKMRNELITKEIETIFKNDTNLIGLKGPFIQNIYYDKKYTRMFGDIDLLTIPENGYIEYSRLRNIGYQLIKNANIFENKHLTIRILRKKYFSNACHVELTKKIHNKENIVLELHGNLNRCNSGKISFNVKNMCIRSRKIEINNTSIRILSPEDNLAFLMFHSIKHLSYTSFIKNQNKTLNLQTFYDVSQIIDMETINWNLFFDLVCEFNILPFVSLYLRIFTDIFNNKIPQKIVDKIYFQCNNTNFPWKSIYNTIIELPTEDIIMGNLTKAPEIDNTYNIAANSKNPVKIWHNFSI